jgi:allophanate hydrolase
LRAANAIAGNPQDAGALEVTYAGPTLAIDAQSARLAFAGADATIEILSDMDATGGRTVETMRSVRLERGQIVRIGPVIRGAVLYIAVEGGFEVEPVLGSVSTYLRGGFGGWQGRALVAGDRLQLRLDSVRQREERRLEGLDLAVPARLRAIDGPQIDYFSSEEIAAFFSSEYTVCAADRMGMRLHGRALSHSGSFDIASDGTAPGSIQISGNGQPIVLLADRQTTGGYPKIATVISADLPALGRIPIGSKIGFERITIETAEALRRALFAKIDGISSGLIGLGGGTAERSTDLLRCNLISGVVDACI